ncbi:major facilitator superfamily domain-containing protein 6-like [Stylophora pistillata]|uniref:major facilitator superfamily domain-containing protein 6-like n=1 Tax=Stylophora pistillata TaxID=50429 RepID=UPI000C03AF9D|nr:major facilitator superfamily domain-containing protein 6-like [Stylophora pistillata]XP_022788502.1 major facilitator superfamily domain-containing protein 6-like [Stylophora pistillata]XP_022788503.1 major facilitator superfamily domain-containing protein 6-like [Stylophora pistillata]XP_022788504.1 major facilitator superfamily domain-containing protein 6-like [Stylophora pistillata]
MSNEGSISSCHPDEESKQHSDAYLCCGYFNQKYVVSKMFYFFYFAALGAILPFLPLFYKQLGLPAKKAGIISGIQPFISFAFTPMWGALSDKTKKGKLVFVISFTALVAVGIAFLLTPMPTCKDKPTGDIHRELISVKNQSVFKKMYQVIAESQNFNRWPVGGEELNDFLALSDKQGGRHQNKFDVFLYLLLVSLVGTIFSCPGLALGDAAAVCLLRRKNDIHQYGKQKRWASIGWGLAAFTFGAMVSDKYLCPLVPGQKRTIDYSLCFYGSISLKLLALFSGLRLDFDLNGKDNTDDMVRERRSGVMAALEAVSRPRYLAFFVIVLYSGMTFGMIMGFLFWHLEDCYSPQIMFSIIPVVRCIADVIVYSVSPHVIIKIGVHNLLYLVLACYVVRLTSYVFVTNPWCYLFIEVLSGLTSAGGWAGFVTYIAYNSVEGAPATLQGMLHGVYHGVGHGLGRVIGGFLFSTYGAQVTFSIFGGLGLIMLLMFASVNKIFEDKPKSQN